MCPRSTSGNRDEPFVLVELTAGFLKDERGIGSMSPLGQAPGFLMESFQRIGREVPHQRHREVRTHHEETKGGQELATGGFHNGIPSSMTPSRRKGQAFCPDGQSRTVLGLRCS